MAFAACLNYAIPPHRYPERSPKGEAKDLFRRDSSASLTLGLRMTGGVFVCITLILYGMTTIRRNDDYRDKIRFYLSSPRWRPNVKLYRAVGAVYGEKGDYKNAVKYLKKAIEVNKIYPSSKEAAAAYHDLEITYMRLSMHKEAEDAFNSVMMSDDELLKKGAGERLSYLKK